MISTRRPAQTARLRILSAVALSVLFCVAGAATGQAEDEDKKTEDRVLQDSPPPAPIVLTGMASFYGSDAGSKTASGERFDPSAMTAAHRTLPFGTKLKVTYEGRSVIVTVNDRGPFKKTRLLDLSTAAARAIGLTDRGVGKVVAEVQ